MKNKKWFLVIAVLLAAAAVLTYLLKPKDIFLQGEVVIRQLSVSPRIAGRVDRILAREGDLVRKGEVVATLYAPDMLAKAAQAHAPRELAQKSYARMKELYEGGVVSAQKLDEARANAQKAVGAVNEVESFVNEMKLVSPVDGEVSSVVLEQGELAAPGISVLTVLDTSDVWVSFNVREDLLSNFALHKEIMLTFPSLGEEYYPFVVTYISKQGDYAVWSATKTRGEFDLKTFEVRAKPVNPMPSLRQGMTALMKISL